MPRGAQSSTESLGCAREAQTPFRDHHHLASSWNLHDLPSPSSHRCKEWVKSTINGSWRHREKTRAQMKGQKERICGEERMMQFHPWLGRCTGAAQAVMMPAEEMAAIHFPENVAPSMEFEGLDQKAATERRISICWFSSNQVFM